MSIGHVLQKYDSKHCCCCCWVTQLCPAFLQPPWTVAHQAPLSMGFSRQEYWSGLPFPSPGDLPDPGIKPESAALAGGFFTTEPGKAQTSQTTLKKKKKTNKLQNTPTYVITLQQFPVRNLIPTPIFKNLCYQTDM